MDYYFRGVKARKHRARSPRPRPPPPGYTPVFHNQLGRFDGGGILIKSKSKSSINCSFSTRTLDPAYLLYSSNIEVKFQRCTFRRHPTTAPVRWLPNCEMTRIGCLVRSSSNWRAANTSSSDKGFHAFRRSSQPTCITSIPCSFTNTKSRGSKSPTCRLMIVFNFNLSKNGKLIAQGCPLRYAPASIIPKLTGGTYNAMIYVFVVAVLLLPRIVVCGEQRQPSSPRSFGRLFLTGIE